MHVVVVGAGAVGTLYGGWLIHGGVDVSFVARGAQLEALRRAGPVLVGDAGELSLGPVEAHSDPRRLKPADVVLVAVKLYDLRTAAQAAALSLVGDGLVVGIQNGVSAYSMLAETFPDHRVMVGPVYSAARLTDPGVVHYSGARHVAIIGSPVQAEHASAATLVEGWRRGGVDAQIASDITYVLWSKFLAFATNAALTCLTRQPAGVVYRDPDLVALARLSIAEIMAIGRAEGVPLPDHAEAATIELLQSFPYDMVASMRQDLDAGRRLELDDIIGTIVQLGRRHGISTPVHATAYACLKPYRDGARPQVVSPQERSVENAAC